MSTDVLFQEITEFCRETHGSSNFHKEEIFVKGKASGEYAPLSFLSKKLPELSSAKSLMAQGFVYDSYELTGNEDFPAWYEHQFGRKLARAVSKNISILQLPNAKAILSAIEKVHIGYKTLWEEQILFNGKNLPVQLGEWFAKSIFGLKQEKSTSQRGFDFYYGDKRVEVKVHWSDLSSPKGVKLRKSLVELSDYCVVIYIARNFMIREVCFLDSNFVLRKFATKGHTMFLKDSDISQYFFSKSSKHLDKVLNSSALLKYSSPQFALKLTEYFSKDHT
jgi:hypothetical protein